MELPDNNMKTEIEQQIEQIIQFPYRLDPFQIEASHAILQNKNVLVTAHTSAGKSTIAQFAIAFFTQPPHEVKRVIYTSPIKALSNQKYNDFCKQFPTLFETNQIGIITGDFQINMDATLLVATTEIIYNYCYTNLAFFENVGCVIFDEVHYINDMERGHVWEGCIALLPSQIRLVMLSATIPNAHEFASWITSIKQCETSLIGTLYRPVPLYQYMYWNNALTLLHSQQEGLTHAYEEIKQTIQRAVKKENIQSTSLVMNSVYHLCDLGYLPALYFCFSRKLCHVYANAIQQSLITGEHSVKVYNYYHELIRKHITNEPDRLNPQLVEMEQYLQRGIAIHHSGLLPILKEIIEVLFLEGYIRVLFVTETFAVGINMPSKTVVFTSLKKHDNREFRYLRVDEYQQIAGRAGRRGMDTVGHVILLPTHCGSEELPSYTIIRNLIQGDKTAVSSKFTINCFLVLQLLLTPYQSIKHMLEMTLQHKETAQQVIGLQRELDQLQQRMVTHVQFFGQDSSHIRFLENYHQQKQQSEQCKQPKERKRIEKQLDLLQMDSPFGNNWKQYYGSYTTWLTLKATYTQLQSTLQGVANYAQTNFRNYIEQLITYGYVVDNPELLFENREGGRDFMDHLDHLKAQQEVLLTVRGKICCLFHECPPFVMTEIVIQGWLEDCSLPEIGGILTMLIADKIQESQDPYENSVEAFQLHKQQQLIQSMIYTNRYETVIDHIEQTNEQYQSLFPHELCKPLLQYGYWWVDGKSMYELMQLVSVRIDYGNFIKHMMKLFNMVQELKKATQLLHNDRLEQKLIAMEPLIMRDIVKIQSLYLGC